MGSDKGLIQYNGMPMIKHLIDLLKKLDINPTIVSGNSEYEKFGATVISDLVNDKGPIGGIYTALEYSHSEKNLILSCDTPNLTEEIITELVDRSINDEITIVEHEGRDHPLIGVYTKSSASKIKEAIQVGELKITLVLESIGFKRLKIQTSKNSKAFLNANNPLDLLN
jgi:molybdopterin-guanine dinucleotide biosynthesis protein A